MPKIVANHQSQTLLRISDDAIRSIIRDYVREAGVRQLERSLQTIVRKHLLHVETKQTTKRKKVIHPATLDGYLGPAKYRQLAIQQDNVIGQANGLAWTKVGGELLKIEAAIITGKGGIELTGKLGEVMRESARAAVTVLRSKLPQMRLANDFFSTHDIHIHVPEGATPKDGPSAGIAIAAALISALTNTKMRRDVAMTGEITIRGKVLPVGGLKEKILAAQRYGMHDVVLPAANQADVAALDDSITEHCSIHFVDHIDDVLARVLEQFDNAWRHVEYHPHIALPLNEVAIQPSTH